MRCRRPPWPDPHPEIGAVSVVTEKFQVKVPVFCGTAKVLKAVPGVTQETTSKAEEATALLGCPPRLRSPGSSG